MAKIKKSYLIFQNMPKILQMI